MKNIAKFMAAGFVLIAPPLHATIVASTAPAMALQPANIPARANFITETYPEFPSETYGYNGTNAVPYGNTQNNEGAFRFHCSSFGIFWSDPIVYPGKPGASHLHQVYGLNVNETEFANMTYTYGRNKSNEVGAKSSCAGGPLFNPSLYWHPVFYDQDGKVVKSNFGVVYYKMDSFDSGTPLGQLSAIRREDQLATDGRVIPSHIPRGFTMVWGYNIANPSPENNAGGPYYKCEISGGSAAWLKNTDGTPTLPLTNGKACNAYTNGVRESFVMTFNSLMCWNGTQLRTSTGRGHLKAPYFDGSRGFRVCPTGYPYLIPHFDFAIWYRPAPGDDITEWHLDSDRMPGYPTRRNGETGHADWFGLWPDDVFEAWQDNCIGQMNTDLAGVKSCVFAGIGDGRFGNYRTVNGDGGVFQGTSLKYATIPVDPSPMNDPETANIHAHGTVAPQGLLSSPESKAAAGAGGIGIIATILAIFRRRKKNES